MSSCNTDALITVIPAGQCVGDSLPTINTNFANLLAEIHDLNFLLPAGVVMLYAGAGVPNSQWLICDGSYQNTTEYPALFAAIGETYGPQSGGRFKLPDLRGRTAVGSNSSNSSLTTRYLGQWGGTESIILSASQLATHTHSLCEGSGHTHTATQATHNHGPVDISHTHYISDRGHTHNVYAGYMAGSNYLPTVGDLGAVGTAHYYGSLYATAPTMLFRHLHAHGWYTTGGGGGSTAYRLDSHATMAGLSGTTGVPLASGSNSTNFWIVPEVGITNDTQLQITIKATPPVGLFGGESSPTSVLVANGISIDPLSQSTSLSAVAPAIAVSNATTNMQVLTAGSSAPHSNLQPFSVLNYVIKAFGCTTTIVPPLTAPPNPPDIVYVEQLVNIGTVATPTITPNGGSGYIGSVEVTLSCTTIGATIHYTTNGSDPTLSSPVYTGAFRLDSNTTVKARGSKVGSYDSTIASAFFEVTPSASGTVAAPVFSPGTGSYSGSTNVTISSATSSSLIYYTTDGTAPTTASTFYTAPVHLTATTQLKARAFKAGLNDSPITTGDYTIYATPPGTVADPIISPAGGSYDSYVTVSITSLTSGATIYYTTDGSTPTTSSNVYINTFAVTSSKQVKAKAVKIGMLDSSVVSASYNIVTSGINNVLMPSIIPNGGSFTNNVQVSIYCGTSDATIYYTTNGSIPSTSSTVYTSPFTINSTTTIRTKGVKTGLADSAVASATFAITAGTDSGTVATPVISPAGGSYQDTVQVTIASATSGSTIYYTTNGSTPTINSILYTGPFNLATTTSVKALAVKSAMNNSAIASADFSVVSTSGNAYTEVVGVASGEEEFTEVAHIIYEDYMKYILDSIDDLQNQINSGANGLPWDGTTKANAIAVTNMMKPVFNSAKGQYIANPTYWGNTGYPHFPVGGARIPAPPGTGATGNVSINSQTFSFTTLVISDEDFSGSPPWPPREWTSTIRLRGPQ